MNLLFKSALSLFLLLFISQSHAAVIAKQILIYNNTNETVYPIIEAPVMVPNDAWLQAQFKELKIKVNTYSQTKIHRVYVNPKTGILPGQSVSLNIPFYSQMVKTPDPAKPDQYIDWWNAIRVYFYDDANFLQLVYDKDKKNAVTPVTAGPGCLSGACGDLTIYSSTAGLPLNDPYQLSEYTFANVTTASEPYTIDPNFVDYDISYVDHVYMCMAMEPQQNIDVGYTGTTMDIKTCRSLLNKFIAKQKWPTYTTDSKGALPHPKIPGMYNILAGNQALTPNTIYSNTAAKWFNCTVISSDPENQQCHSVDDLFFKNLINYQINCGGVPSMQEYLQHIYGWVPFSCPALSNELVNTPFADYDAAQQAYQKLQYDYQNNPAPEVLFNPYVELIHSKDYLAMNAYAFSIDDAVGNMNEQGDGVIFAIGGSYGLPNKQPYDPAKVTHINLGYPATGPTWVAYGICTDTPGTKLAKGNLSFPVQSVGYPCEISLKDSKNTLYHFTLLAAPPYTGSDKSKYISCKTGDNWCNGINVNFATEHDISTPPTGG